MLQLLVRHGESLSNAEGRVQGQSDVALSPLGRVQAGAVGAWARSFSAGGEGPISEIWSSPLVRARQTADIVAAALGLPVRFDDRLKELHAGVFQGHLWSELDWWFPEAAARWRAGDPDDPIPGGESRRMLAARGRAALEELAGRPVGSMLVVAHGGLLTATLGCLLGGHDPLLAGVASRPFTRLPALANASITRLLWPGPRLDRFNDTTHLSSGIVAGTAGGDGA
ncbi:MAG: histidine phosphatase family protein [Planctomycetaceae bacterium]